MSAGQFHRPKPAGTPNAFDLARSKAPTVFATPVELGRQVLAKKRASPEGQANILAGKARVDALISRSKAGRG